MPKYDNFWLNHLLHVNVGKVFRMSWLILERENLCFPFCAALKCEQKTSEWLFRALQALILIDFMIVFVTSVCPHAVCISAPDRKSVV